MKSATLKEIKQELQHKSATELLDMRLKEKAKKRARYDNMMRRLKEEQRVLDQQQEWSEKQ